MDKEVIKEGKLNEVIIEETIRPNGTRRIQQNFEFCPTLAEQHTAHLTDINYLMEKYKPDELAAYIAARNEYRREIIGHDFSQEPSLQEARNIVLTSKQEFEKLSDEVKKNFANHLEFLKFIDNPQNAEKMEKLGLITKKQIKKIQMEDTITIPKETKTKTQDEDKEQKK